MDIFGTFFGVIMLAATILLYFVPSIVAVRRNHRCKGLIIVLNILLGGTGVIWIIALVWACNADVNAQ
jgi:cell shape-determining protein MreD